ncbi:hypothetical protein H072_2473 [Dactylellina haptotyla CBS 200.50]|uniref:Uncharacterized protein n=1 Tax=Dactylellina haptotyla (strain CBS 200.50) TaxID=1284197 RepID=S8AKR0_DACHA|nr:hypothetical protein H072_2473 [Dactylellina haptotyla CBS 200.50]
MFGQKGSDGCKCYKTGACNCGTGCLCSDLRGKCAAKTPRDNSNYEALCKELGEAEANAIWAQARGDANGAPADPPGPGNGNTLPPTPREPEILEPRARKAKLAKKRRNQKRNQRRNERKGHRKPNGKKP